MISMKLNTDADAYTKDSFEFSSDDGGQMGLRVK
jgi:hypothetical protein